MSGWIIKRGEREVPIPDESTLRRWADEGRFNPSDLIFHPTLQRWLYASEVLEIKAAVEKRRIIETKPIDRPAEPQPATVAQLVVATEFVISQDGQQFRAPDVSTLQRWASERRIRSDSHVFHPLLQQWVIARELSELRATYAQSENISTLAQNYRQLVLWVGAQLLIYLAFQLTSNVFRSPVLALLFIALMIASVIALVIYAYRTAASLGSDVAPFWAIAMLIPCINIITLLALSSKANAFCKAHGIPVGLFGPRV